MLTWFTNLLPKSAQPVAKTFVALITPAVLLVANGLISGDWDPEALKVVVAALITGAAVYGVPNNAE